MNTIKKAAISLALTFPVYAWAAGDVQAGKAVFDARCASCHSIGPSARGAFGPHLNSLFGRPAGGTSDYHYSPAMKNSRLVWSDETLTAFLQDPGKVVPGNKMRFWGISNKQKINDLIAYLRQYQ